MLEHFFIPLILSLAMISGTWLALLAFQSWENHRYSVRRMRQHRIVKAIQKPTRLIVPVKGPDAGIEMNLRGFFCQDHPDFELVFAVESVEDPAVSVIRQLRKKFPAVRCKIVFAGRATAHGQKVHNLLAATDGIPERTKMLAFADADIRPEKDWLRMLCQPVLRSRRYSANTGYRWILPSRLNPGSLLVYCINCATAGLLGAGRHHPVWGGSWAIRRKEFESLGIRQAWQGTLSDDLVVSQVLALGGRGVTFDPRCLSKSMIDLNLPSALEFLRRQFVIAKFYSRRLFMCALCLLAISVAGWWGLVWLALYGDPQSRFIAVCGLAVFYAGTLFRNILRQNVFSVRDAMGFRKHRIAAAIDIVSGPLTTTATFAIMLWSAFGQRIVWRGNRYLIQRSGQIRIVEATAACNKPVTVPPVAAFEKQHPLSSSVSPRRWSILLRLPLRFPKRSHRR